MSGYKLRYEVIGHRVGDSLEVHHKLITNPCLEILMLSFQNGDRVIYSGIHKARVINVLSNGEVRIKFKDRKLIPDRMDSPPHLIERDHSCAPSWPVDPKVECPKCEVPWKEIPGFSFSYFDCPECGMKKEKACS